MFVGVEGVARFLPPHEAGREDRFSASGGNGCEAAEGAGFAGAAGGSEERAAKNDVVAGFVPAIQAYWLR
ncbi:MAG: hypothetical protein ACRED8_10030 [Caulobacteraceae bacterium]